MKLISANWKCAKFLFLSAALFSFASSVQAIDKRWFASAEAGWATVADSYDEIHYNYSRWEFSHDINYSLSYGYQLDTFSVEGEYSYRRFDAHRRFLLPSPLLISPLVSNLQGYQDQHTILILGYWYPCTNKAVQPYIGMGAGYSRISWVNVKTGDTSDHITDNDTVFTSKITTGIEFRLANSASLLMSYSYLRPNNIKLTDNLGNTGKLNKQEINIMDVGIKYYF